MSDKSSTSGIGDIPPSYTGPVSEKETGAYKAAKTAVIVLSALILLALVALIAGGIFKLSGARAPQADTKAPQAGPAAAAVFQRPPDATIVSMESQPDRLILRVRSGDAEEIDIFDTRNGQLVGQVKGGLAPPR
jgi:hypothetical protein